MSKIIYIVYWNNGTKTAGIEYHDPRTKINYNNVGANSGCIFKNLFKNKRDADKKVRYLNEQYEKGEYII